MHFEQPSIEIPCHQERRFCTHNDLSERSSIHRLKTSKTNIAIRHTICSCLSTERHYHQPTKRKIRFYPNRNRKTFQNIPFLVESKTTPNLGLCLQLSVCGFGSDMNLTLHVQEEKFAKTVVD